jgi:hypothetical protein
MQVRSVSALVAALVAVTGSLLGTAQGAAAQPVPQARSTSARPHASLTVARSAPVGATVQITGTVRPAAPRHTVKLQQRTAGKWRTVVTKKTNRHAAYRFARTFRAAGTSRYRVVVPRHGAIRKIVSKPHSIRVAVPGHDVSFPQCAGVLPAGSFGIVGVDGGRPFDVNGCLAQEIAWAATLGPVAYYANTANPGPTMSDHWPVGQPAPRACSPAAPDSTSCAYDYGWNAAADSYARAAAAAAAVGAPPVAGATWWLDVEAGNTWESLEFGETAPYLANDVAALSGMRDYLRAVGVRTVGVYSTAHQWQRITGGSSFGKAPVWYAGVGGPSSAAAHCGSAYSFTGGPVRLAQYASAGYDANHAC